MQSLPHESLLQLLAEISVAFVGFSMLASVFRASKGDDRVRFADFRNVAETGLLATVGSLTPLFLSVNDARILRHHERGARKLSQRAGHRAQPLSSRSFDNRATPWKAPKFK